MAARGPNDQRTLLWAWVTPDAAKEEAPEMLVLSASDVRSSVTMPEAINAAEAAYMAASSGKLQAPLRTPVNVPEAPGISLFMPGYVPGAKALGAKIVSVFEKNPARGLATIQAVFVLLDPETGQPLCVMEASSLTALRTGAGSGAATRVLARPDASVAAIFGAGAQARTQLEAIAAVCPLERVLVYDVSAERVSSFIRDMSQLLERVRPGATLAAASDPNSAVRESSVVACATTSATPVFSGEAAQPGTHINAIGSYTPDRRELDEVILRRASKVVVDSLEAALSEAGDFIIPMKSGVFTKDLIHGEVGEVLLGEKSGRESPDEITVYKAVGIAPLDLVVGQLVYTRALEKGLGTVVKGFGA